MELTNTTSFSDRFVRRVVTFVTPEHVVRPKTLIVRTARKYPFRGRAVPGLLRVTASIGDARWFPMERERLGNGYQPIVLESPEEALVYVLAHEIQHLWQFWNRGRLSERDADLYAKGRLAAWTS